MRNLIRNNFTKNRGIKFRGRRVDWISLRGKGTACATKILRYCFVGASPQATPQLWQLL